VSDLDTSHISKRPGSHGRGANRDINKRVNSLEEFAANEEMEVCLDWHFKVVSAIQGPCSFVQVHYQNKT
jgi:hypothetical protein